jgi:hypothetical protein
MTSFSAPLEIHVHGEILLRNDVDFKALQEATKPLWKYAGAKSLTEGAQSLYEEEPENSNGSYILRLPSDQSA